ncbi:MAG: NUDIX domain-containing protein [Pseudomonadota bacterium]
MAAVFFFGSLRDRALLEIVLGRSVASDEIIIAKAEGYAARCLRDEAYPVLFASPGAVADGVVVDNLSALDMRRLVFFEDAEYVLAPISVTVGGDVREAQFFRDTEIAPTTDEEWDFARWQREERAVALECARELMDYFDTPVGEDLDRIWPGIMTRARMRVRAAAETPVTGRLRGARAPGDVEQIETRRPFTGFFAMEERILRHRRFDGGWSPEMSRLALVSGDAVTVVPYDVRRDEVMLIEQFRAPMLARGDRCPWGVEAIAGRVDKENDAEGAARREALEEGGLTLGRMALVAGYYSSPGIAAEHLTSYIGEADLSAAGGTFGVVDEHEDIRAFTVSLQEALEGVASGEINNGPAILSLLWLQANADRLAEAWAIPTTGSG